MPTPDFNTFTGISYNVQGLKQDQKLEELALYIANNKIDFLCLQETWLCGSEPQDITTALTSKSPNPTNPNSTILTKCTLFQHAQETQPGRGSGGVGIMLSPSGLKAWERAGSPDPILMPLIEGIGRAMGLELHLLDKEENTMKFFVISAYHPDSTRCEKNPELHDFFLESLLELYAKAPRDATIISGEDINANLGHNMTRTTEDNNQQASKITGPFGTFKLPNERGIKVGHILDIAELTSASTWFQKKNGRYDTHYDHRHSQRRQVDHIMISQKNRRSTIDCKRTKPITHSNHMPIFIKVRLIKKLSIRVNSRKKRNKRKRNRRRQHHRNRPRTKRHTPQVNRAKLKCNQMKLRFQQAVKARIQQTQKDMDSPDSFVQ